MLGHLWRWNACDSHFSFKELIGGLAWRESGLLWSQFSRHAKGRVLERLSLLSHFFLNIIESHKQLFVADCDILWNRSDLNFSLLNGLWKHDLVGLFRRLFLDIEGLVFIRFLFICCIHLLSRWLINLHLADLKLHGRYFVHWTAAAILVIQSLCRRHLLTEAFLADIIPGSLVHQRLLGIVI